MNVYLQDLEQLPLSWIFEKSQPNFRELYKAMPQQTVACFASSARYELIYPSMDTKSSGVLDIYTECALCNMALYY